jgi:hypothetical protein
MTDPIRTRHDKPEPSLDDLLAAEKTWDVFYDLLVSVGDLLHPDTLTTYKDRYREAQIAEQRLRNINRGVRKASEMKQTL